MVYVEAVMGLNFLVDLLLILGANGLSGHPPGYARAILGAFVGGLYGGACLIPGFSFLGNGLWRFVFFLLMSIVAFGLDRSALRRAVVMGILSMALGGMAMAISRGGIITVILCAGGLWIACRLGRWDAAGRIRQLRLQLGGKERSLRAMMDSGNLLRDPVSGLPVIVVGAAVAGDLLGLLPEQLAAPVETVGSVQGLRLIPYRAVGNERGLLLAKKMDSVHMDGRKVDCLVAFAPHSIGAKGCEALVGGMLG